MWPTVSTFGLSHSIKLVLKVAHIGRKMAKFRNQGQTAPDIFGYRQTILFSDFGQILSEICRDLRRRKPFGRRWSAAFLRRRATIVMADAGGHVDRGARLRRRWLSAPPRVPRVRTFSGSRRCSLVGRSAGRSRRADRYEYMERVAAMCRAGPQRASLCSGLALRARSSGLPMVSPGMGSLAQPLAWVRGVGRLQPVGQASGGGAFLISRRGGVASRGCDDRVDSPPARLLVALHAGFCTFHGRDSASLGDLISATVRAIWRRHPGHLRTAGVGGRS